MLIDTHAHLNFPQFQNINLTDLLKRAADAGVAKIINVGSDLKASQGSVALAQQYPNIFASVGIHPHDTEKAAADQSQLTALEGLLRQPKVQALGEIGLDYYKNFSPKESQKTIFEKQLDLASKYQKPVIIHCREAETDTLDMIKAHRPVKAVFHCFPGPLSFAKQILDLGYFISFTGNITFSKNLNGQEAAKYVPLDRLMLETDCPFMAPEPHRGQTNEPAFVKYVAKKIAELKNISPTELENITTKNAEEFFAI